MLFNRNDTIDSKILKKYGMFLNRHNPNSIFIRANQKAFESISSDLFKMQELSRNQTPGWLYHTCYTIKNFIFIYRKNILKANLYKTKSTQLSGNISFKDIKSNSQGKNQYYFE